MVCRSLAGKTWVCNPSILRWMQTIMIRPIITYGAAAWYNKIRQGTARQTLSKIQRLACLCITGAIRPCPTAAMQVMLDLTPLHLTVQGALFRMDKNGVGGGLLVSRRVWISLSKSIPYLMYPKDETIKKFNFGSTFFTKLSNKRECLGEHTIK